MIRLAAILLSLFSSPQSPSTPQFEVATVKPVGPVEGPGLRYVACHGTDNTVAATVALGRCISKSVPLRLVVAYAYDLPGFMIGQVLVSNSPILGDVYDIEATAGQPVPHAQLRMMLQSLLQERFKFVAHREKREIDVFALLVAKSGSKLKLAPKDSPCVDSATLGPCHGFMGGRGRGLHGQSVSMDDLAENLSNWAGRTVVDKTGLNGLFNILTTPWVPDNPGPNFAAEAGTDPANLPTFFTMLQEQLGLRLEARKQMADVLVVDHIEKAAGTGR